MANVNVMDKSKRFNSTTITVEEKEMKLADDKLKTVTVPT